MKRIVVLMAVAAAVSASFAQYRAVDRQAGMMVEGRPFLTDAARYNSYDLAGSPLGLFDLSRPKERMSIDLGYRYYGFGGETGHYLRGQKIRMGQPGRSFFELFYGPDIMSYDNGPNDISLPLHRFGLALASQAAEGTFRTSIMFDGYIGTQEWENGDSVRFIGGFEKLRLDVGGQVHPFLRIGFFINFTGHADTLHVPNNNIGRRDFSAQTNLPEIGGNIDFGDDEMPVRSNLSVSYAFSRFVYSSQWLSGVPQVDARGNASAIRNDSLRVALVTHGEIPVSEEYAAALGLLLGISNNSGKMRNPHEDNWPWLMYDAVPNTGYSLFGFHFGVGAGGRLHKYADVHVEYSLAAMSLDCGSAYPQPAVESRTLHSISIGASTQLNKYLELPLHITPRIAYFISGASGILGPVHSGLDPVNVISGKSKNVLYRPETYLSGDGVYLPGFSRTRGVTLGADGALEESLLVSLWMTFLSKDGVKKDGMEMGLSVGYSM
ncbi:MAG: hypothetical protein FWB85_05055 [Chitinispirillia bacterium]|nr:hypothetical protein [Chitinispirillia bacterium]